MCDLTNDGWSKQADGFEASESFFEYYETISVSKDALERKLFAKWRHDRDIGENIYYLDEKKVSVNMFEEFPDAFGERENRAVWHDFTEENVARVF